MKAITAKRCDRFYLEFPKLEIYKHLPIEVIIFG